MSVRLLAANQFLWATGFDGASPNAVSIDPPSGALFITGSFARGMVQLSPNLKPMYNTVRPFVDSSILECSNVFSRARRARRARISWL